jgi:hypothetical protein
MLFGGTERNACRRLALARHVDKIQLDSDINAIVSGH